MLFFMFRSEQDRHWFGFTSDETGENLPAELAPWRQPSSEAIPASLELAAIILSDPVSPVHQGDRLLYGVDW
jgi:hypothetical protein